jgi:hypothetical protein
VCPEAKINRIVAQRLGVPVHRVSGAPLWIEAQIELEMLRIESDVAKT